MSALEEVRDLNGNAVRVGDRIAVTVAAWDKPQLHVGEVIGFSEKRMTVRVEATSESYRYGETSVVDPALKRFVRLA